MRLPHPIQVQPEDSGRQKRSEAKDPSADLSRFSWKGDPSDAGLLWGCASVSGTWPPRARGWVLTRGQGRVHSPGLGFWEPRGRLGKEVPTSHICYGPNPGHPSP